MNGARLTGVLRDRDEQVARTSKSYCLREVIVAETNLVWAPKIGVAIQLRSKGWSDLVFEDLKNQAPRRHDGRELAALDQNWTDGRSILRQEALASPNFVVCTMCI